MELIDEIEAEDSYTALITAVARYLKVADAQFYSKKYLYTFAKGTKPYPGEFHKIFSYADEPYCFEWVSNARAEHEASVDLAKHLCDAFDLNAQPEKRRDGTFVKIMFDKKLDEIAAIIAKLEQQTELFKNQPPKDKKAPAADSEGIENLLHVADQIMPYSERPKPERQKPERKDYRAQVRQERSRPFESSPARGGPVRAAHTYRLPYRDDD